MKSRRMIAVMLAFAMVLSVSCVNVAAADDGAKSATFTVGGDSGTKFNVFDNELLAKDDVQAGNTATFTTSDSSDFKIGYTPKADPDPDEPSYGNSATFTVNEGGEWWSSFNIKEHLNPDDLKAENTITFSCADDAFEITYLHKDSEEWTESKSENGVVVLDLAEVDLNADISVVFTGGATGELTITWTVTPTESTTDPDQPDPDQPDPDEPDPDEPSGGNSATFTVNEGDNVWYALFSIKEYLDPSDLVATNTITFSCEGSDVKCAYTSIAGAWTQTESSVLDLADVNLDNDIFVVLSPGVAGEYTVTWTVAPTESGTDPDEPDEPDEPDQPDEPGKENSATFTVLEDNVWYAQFSIKEYLDPSDLVATNTITFSCEGSDVKCAYTSIAGAWTQTESSVLDLADVSLDNGIFVILAPGETGTFTVTWTVAPTADATATGIGNFANRVFSFFRAVCNPIVAKVSALVRSLATFSSSGDDEPAAGQEENLTTIDSENGVVALDLKNVDPDQPVYIIFPDDASGSITVTCKVAPTGSETDPGTDEPDQPDEPSYGNSATFTVSESEIYWSSHSLSEYLDPADLKAENTIIFTSDVAFEITYINNDNEWIESKSSNGVVTLDLADVNLGADISVVFTGGVAGELTITWTVVLTEDYEPPVEPKPETKKNCATFDVSESEAYWASFSLGEYLDTTGLTADDTITFSCDGDAFEITYLHSGTEEWTESKSSNGVVVLKLEDVDLGADISVVFTGGVYGSLTVSWKVERAKKALDVDNGTAVTIENEDGTQIEGVQFEVVENDLLVPSDLDSENTVTFTCEQSEFTIAYTPAGSEAAPVSYNGGAALRVIGIAPLFQRLGGSFFKPVDLTAFTSSIGFAAPASDSSGTGGNLEKVNSVGGVVTLDLANVDTTQPINIIFPAAAVSEGKELTVTCTVAATEVPASKPVTQPDYSGGGNDEDYDHSSSTSPVAPADPVFDGKNSAIFTVSDDEVWWAQFSINAYLNSDDLKPENIITFTCANSEFKIAYIDSSNEWTTVDSAGGVLAFDLATVNLGADISIVFSTGNAGKYTVSWSVAANPNYTPGTDEPQPGEGTAPADPVFDGKNSAIFTVSDDEVWWAQFSINAYLNSDDLKPENIITFTCANSEFKIAYIDSSNEWTTVDSAGGVLAFDLATVNLGADISIVFSTGNAGKYTVSWSVAANPNYTPGTDEPQPGEGTAPADPVFDGKNSAIFTVGESEAWWAQFSLNEYLAYIDLVEENTVTFTCADAAFVIAYTNNDGEWTTIEASNGVVALDLADVNLFADIFLVFTGGVAGEFTASWTVAPTEGGVDPDQPDTDPSDSDPSDSDPSDSDPSDEPSSDSPSDPTENTAQVKESSHLGLWITLAVILVAAAAGAVTFVIFKKRKAAHKARK